MRNEDQVKIMKIGGNKRLNNLLKCYNVDRNKVDYQTLYKSKLIDYHKTWLKKEIYKEGIPKAPEVKEALKPYDNEEEKEIKSVSINTSTSVNTNKFGAISSDFQEPEEPPSYLSYFSSWVGNVVNTSAEYASNLKDKINETSIGSKILDAGGYVGGKTVDVIKGTGQIVYEKGSDIAVINLLYNK